jgi:hypothetical protein
VNLSTLSTSFDDEQWKVPEDAMWVTQTYLGTVEPDAKMFVYYLFETTMTLKENSPNACSVSWNNWAKCMATRCRC